jgi:hypothetical protein
MGHPVLRFAHYWTRKSSEMGVYIGGPKWGSILVVHIWFKMHKYRLVTSRSVYTYVCPLLDPEVFRGVQNGGPYWWTSAVVHIVVQNGIQNIYQKNIVKDLKMHIFV